MFIPTLEDLQRVEEKVDYLIQAIDQLHEKKVKLLSSHEVAMGLNISYRTFLNLRPELIKHGLKKIGGNWVMKETDLQKYIDQLR